jgi:hypothetical protein
MRNGRKRRQKSMQRLHHMRANEHFQRTQRCLDHLTAAGGWVLHDAQIKDAADLENNDQRWAWQVPAINSCRLTIKDTIAARALLSGQHILCVGDLHARLYFASLVYLLNGTRAPEEVAPGFPQHKSECWSPDGTKRGGYSFAGWDHIRKSSPCHLRFYGTKTGTLHNLTMNHPAGSKAWWGRGTSRDVMTLLLRDKLIWTTFRVPGTTEAEGITISYLWKGVVRTSGSYKAQHARHLAQVAAKVGTPPTILLAAMGAYDSQWQSVEEVSKRLSGLFEGIAQKWPADEAGAPLVMFSGPSSCARGKKFSVYMGKETRHNHFHNMANASSLIPYARQAATNHSVLYIDTSKVQMEVPPLRSSPCHYDLPIGRMVEVLVQVVLSALASGRNP